MLDEKRLPREKGNCHTVHAPSIAIPIPALTTWASRITSALPLLFRPFPFTANVKRHQQRR